MIHTCDGCARKPQKVCNPLLAAELNWHPKSTANTLIKVSQHLIVHWNYAEDIWLFERMELATTSQSVTETDSKSEPHMGIRSSWVTSAWKAIALVQKSRQEFILIDVKDVGESNKYTKQQLCFYYFCWNLSAIQILFGIFNIIGCAQVEGLLKTAHVLRKCVSKLRVRFEVCSSLHHYRAETSKSRREC